MGRFEEAIKRAEIDLAVCGDPEFIRSMRELLVNTRERGVNVYIIVYELPGLSIEDVDLPSIGKIKKAVSGDLLVVSDSKIGVLAQRRLGPTIKPEYGLTIEEPVLVDYLLHDFFNRWIRSKSIRDELVRLPTSYTIFRLALYETSRLLKEGENIHGVFHGRWVQTGREGIVEGRILESTIDLTTGLSYFVIDTGLERIKVGGPDAVVEDFATARVELKRGA